MRPLRICQSLPTWVWELRLVVIALSVAVVGRWTGHHYLGALGAVAVLPLGFFLRGIVAERGAVVGAFVAAFASMMIPDEVGPAPIESWLLIGLTSLTAVAASSQVASDEDEVVESSPPVRRHFTVVVECGGGPSQASGVPLRPKGTPRFDPERRALSPRLGYRRPGQRPKVVARRIQSGC